MDFSANNGLTVAAPDGVTDEFVFTQAVLAAGELGVRPQLVGQGKIKMDPRIETQLLHASLLCGMKPDQGPAYRLQLFLVANQDLNSKSRQSDFQRTIETGVDQKGLWKNHQSKGSGEYVLTPLGYLTAVQQVGLVTPRYEPLPISRFVCTLTGRILGVEIEIQTRGRNSTIFLNSSRFPSAKAACAFLEKRTGSPIPTEGDSAVRVLYNLAIDSEFSIVFESD